MVYWKLFPGEGALDFQTCWSWEYGESSGGLALLRYGEKQRKHWEMKTEVTWGRECEG